jgi:membrane-bound lytic murein transglycosylase D
VPGQGNAETLQTMLGMESSPAIIQPEPKPRHKKQKLSPKPKQKNSTAKGSRAKAKVTPKNTKAKPVAPTPVRKPVNTKK